MSMLSLKVTITNECQHAKTLLKRKKRSIFIPTDGRRMLPPVGEMADDGGSLQ